MVALSYSAIIPKNKSEMVSLKTLILVCAVFNSASALTTENLAVSELSESSIGFARNPRNIGWARRHRHRHRHRYRHRFRLFLLPFDQQTEQEFEEEISTLKDHMSILETVAYEDEEALAVPSEASFKDKAPLCKNIDNSTVNLQNRVMDSIKRTLAFFESHMDHLDTAEPSFALLELKVMDDKYGGELQKEYPLSDWISRMCGDFRNKEEAKFCESLTKLWKARAGKWQAESIIHKFREDFNSIGLEKEVLWGRLNGECQFALVNRCEVPYICERTLFDPTPRSQYMLTHQMLQRIFAELGTCSATKDLIDPEVNHRLCAKIYKEAQLIQALNTPDFFRDLFAQQVGICGYMGYTNFMRQDWLELILSWQSKSDYGCFLKDIEEEGVKYMSTDTAVKRLPTKAEKMKGLDPNEYCLPHFTSVSLSALVAYWDFLKENCNET